MNRRRFLTTVAGGLGTMATAGCLERMDETGPRRPPASPAGEGEGGGPTGGTRKLVIETYGIEEGEDGNLTVPVVVENTGDSRKTGTLVGVVTVGDESYRVEKQVSVAGGTEAEVTLVFGVAYEKFVANGSLSLQWA